MICWPQRLSSTWPGCTEPRSFESSALHIAPLPRCSAWPSPLDVAPLGGGPANGVGDFTYTATAVDNAADDVDSDGQVAGSSTGPQHKALTTAIRSNPKFHRNLTRC